MRLVLVLLFLGFASPLHSQDALLPADLQAKLLTRVFSYDQALSRFPGNELVVGVLYQNVHRPSRAAATSIQQALQALGESGRVQGRPVRVVLLDLGQGEALTARLARAGVHVLYVAPLRAADLKDVLRAARGARAATFTAVPDYLTDGLCVGVGLRGDRPAILLNLASARAEGAQFGAQLLQVAQIVQR